MSSPLESKAAEVVALVKNVGKSKRRLTSLATQLINEKDKLSSLQLSHRDAQAQLNELSRLPIAE